ncbi:MAG: hypothetical protein LBK99_15265 [Opitutaceae bacterium]|jgi:hypothetical protein|nr:hypothetical protein [Opitutaceae bacterium]
MNHHDYIPGGDAPFHDFQETLIAYLPAHLAAWGLTTVQIAGLVAKQVIWREAHAMAINPATRTSAAIQVKNTARIALETEIRLVTGAYLARNPLVTDKDRINMGLTVRKTTRPPAPVPVKRPGVKITLISPGRVIVAFFDADNIHRAKPGQVHGAEVESTIRDTAPTTDADFTRSAFCTRSPFTFDFDISQRGKTLWLRLRWENTRGEKGPWTDIFQVIIP